jgi:hypothetical protein
MSLRVPSGEFVSGGAFVEACKTGDWKTVEKTATLWWRMFNQTTLNEGLACAAQEGQVDIVRRLLKWANPRYDTDRSFRMASRERHIECVKLLLPHVPANTCENVCLWGALQRGDVEMAKLLLPLCEKVSPNAALEYAAKFGHLEVVRWLLTIANPYYRESLALRNALQGGHTQVVELLMPVSNCMTARTVMECQNEYDPQLYSQLEEFIQRQQLRTQLHQATYEMQKESAKPKRKM